MGNTICYYMCCCCLCCRRKYVKQHRLKEKRHTIAMINQLSKSHRPRTVGTDPTKVELKDMAKTFVVPSKKFKTAEDVIAYEGYRLGKTIGSGSFAKVHLITHIKTGEELACKVLNLTDKLMDGRKRRLMRSRDIKNELFTLEKLTHPHIIRLVTHFTIIRDDLMSTFYIVMQYAIEGSLQEHTRLRGPFAERFCRLWFAQMLSALVYMHSNRIVHRDLKPQNILLDVNQDVLISDFGLSRIDSSGQDLESKTFCGTPQYMAPELLNMRLKKDELKNQNPVDRDSIDALSYKAMPVDVWALGCVVFFCFTQTVPYIVYHKDMSRWPQTVEQMKHREYSLPSRLNPTPEFVQIIRRMLEPNPTSRPTMLQLTTDKWIAEKYKVVDKKVQKDMKKINK
ncbi:uncharacterized protein LOC128964232 [Oppia nitens]|uniref:uncharacterized protein LOC128964232 n=1 Tax=Oppia nitens TaxID=1686743 RepID=UPI0023DCE738|nr:uncharacterized protein LOC128964232 [Oppia nitens]